MNENKLKSGRKALIIGGARLSNKISGILKAEGYAKVLATQDCIAAGEMAVAYFKQHAPAGVWPIVNRGELAVLYCFVFLFIASRGSGILSIDALRGKARK